MQCHKRMLVLLTRQNWPTSWFQNTNNLLVQLNQDIHVNFNYISIGFVTVELSGCKPNPCGPNTECIEQPNGTATCQCKPGFAPGKSKEEGCEPRQEPVGAVFCEPGPCGINADCLVTEIGEDCQCKAGFTGNPFQGCLPPSVPTDPCSPSPCGRNTNCEIRNKQAICTCIPGMIGDPTSPQGCRPECTIQAHCKPNLACIGQRCQDPCPGSCGVNANCNVENHNPICNCPPGYTGDPFFLCEADSYVPPPEPKDPCNPNPCGSNAQCTVINGQVACSCQKNYVGDPNVSCRPECILSSDCPVSQACIRSTCQDPCPGTCGINAVCVVNNHNPICSCQKGHSGDPFSQCSPTRKSIFSANLRFVGGIRTQHL